MDRVVIIWYNINNNTQGQSNGQKFENISSSLRAEIDTAAHTQHMRDFAVEMTNSVAKEVRELQCKVRKNYSSKCHLYSPIQWMVESSLPRLTAVQQTSTRRERFGSVAMYSEEHYVRNRNQALRTATPVQKPNHQCGGMGTHGLHSATGISISSILMAAPTRTRTGHGQLSSHRL